jgi:hypothetical protein
MNAQSAADTSVFNSPNPEENVIPVQGDPLRPPEKRPVTYPDLVQQEVPDDFILGNDRAVAQARMAEESTSRASDRRSLLGARGTLRDILGTLGDFFLIGGGGEPMYAPMREREKWADALQGMTAGPEAERAAFERAMRINPEATMALMKERDYARTQQGHLGLRSQEYLRNFVNDARKSFAGIAATAAISEDQEFRQKALQAINAQAQRLAEQGLISPDDPLLSGDLNMIAGGGANVNQTLNRPLQEERIDIARGNLAARNRAIGIMAQRLNLDSEKLKRLIANDKWDEFVDLIEIALEVQKEGRLNRKAGRSSLPKPPSGVNRKTPMFRP